jgi:hypothetical protein
VKGETSFVITLGHWEYVDFPSFDSYDAFVRTWVKDVDIEQVLEMPPGVCVRHWL